ncbi:MAG: hypothetical protein MJZ20_14680 [Bacteroidaceae bacterium]|nr:hypothetical protein [Bacteroidaceae bacterium]
MTAAGCSTCSDADGKCLACTDSSKTPNAAGTACETPVTPTDDDGCELYMDAAET